MVLGAYFPVNSVLLSLRLRVCLVIVLIQRDKPLRLNLQVHTLVGFEIRRVELSVLKHPTAATACSDCVTCQARCTSKVRFVLTIALRMTRILRMHAVKATFAGLPAWVSLA